MWGSFRLTFGLGDEERKLKFTVATYKLYYVTLSEFIPGAFCHRKLRSLAVQNIIIRKVECVRICFCA
jgi:hypothetical protein